MTRMTRTALAASLAGLTLSSAAFFGTPTSAQAPSPSGSAAASGLTLDAAQKSKADARQAQFQKDVMALRADMKMTNAQKQIKYTSLAQSMGRDMMAILTPAQRALVMKQRQIDSQYNSDMLALQADKSLSETQKKERSLQITEKARNASIALLPPAQRAAALKRGIAAEQAQQLNQQLQSSETPAQKQKLQALMESAKRAIRTIYVDKNLSDPVKAQKIVAVRKETLSRDLALLTPAQRGLYSRIQALVQPPTR